MESKGVKAPERFTVQDETVADAASAVDLLAARKEIDKKRIFIVGHSLGAFAAPRIAVAAPPLPAWCCSPGNSRPLEDLIVEQVEYLLSVQELPEEQKKEALEKIKKQVARVKDPKLSADTPSAELVFGVPAPYWLDLREYNPTATAAKLKQPMLILQGERDYQVTMADFDGWKRPGRPQKRRVQVVSPVKPPLHRRQG